ncbi:MAG TPA: ABC transporter ATP-binding protein [Ktedonobacteraceae bacterium]
MQTEIATDTLIAIRHVSKLYRNTQALNDVTLEIPRGTIYGLIGPNGAGKTTLIRILAALLTPTIGEVWFEDEEVSKSPAQVQRKIGYMPDFFGVYPDLTVVEYLEFYAGIHGIPKQKQAQIISDLLELVDLATKRDAFVETLSRGMKQRLCLARALVHDPEVLLLDEPASGLDPRARVELRELVRTLRNIGKTLIISSHILPELSEMCTDIAIMQNGRLVISGNVNTIVHRMTDHHPVEIRLLNSERIEQAIATLNEIENISNVEKENDTTLQIDFNGDEQELNAVLVQLIQHDIPVVSFAPHSASGRLEEVFLSITEEEDSV